MTLRKVSKFEVDVTRTLVLSTTVTVVARDEDEAAEKAAALAGEGIMSWSIKDKYDWEEESDDVTAENVGEM